MPDPTSTDRLALALCPHRQLCQVPMRDCRKDCRRDSAAVITELAQILRERHGGSSSVADWLDGLGAMVDHCRRLWAHILEDLGPPEGCMLPGWLAAVFCVLFPLDGLRSILRAQSAMNLQRRTRTIHGIEFSDSVFLAMAAADDRWYRFTRGPGGIVTVEARQPDA